MDPVGGVASVLTLLNAAAGTCGILHTLVLNIKDASHDIRAQNEKLHCLHLTITQLAEIYTKLPEEHQRGAPWHKWIEDFAIEVACIKERVQRKAASVENASLGLRLQEGCRWILFDRQLRRFYESLEHWNIVFLQAVSVSQLQLMVRVDQTTMQTALLAKKIWSGLSDAPPNYTISAEQGCLQPDVTWPLQTELDTNKPARAIVPHRTVSIGGFEHLAVRVPPVEVCNLASVRFTHGLWFETISLKLVFGPIIGRRRSQNSGRDPSSQPGGYCVITSFLLPFWGVRRFSFFARAFLPSSTYPCLDFNFKLKMPRIFRPNSPWFQAAQKGHTASLRQWMVTGEVTVSDVTLHGDTLLHMAAARGQTDMISFLIDAGADVNVANDLGQTPLHFCISNGHNYDCVRRLLAAGGDLFQQTLGGRTALHTFYNSVTAQLLQHCLDEIDFFAQDEKGMTVLHYASWSKLSSAKLVEHILVRNSPNTPDRNHIYDQPLDIKDRWGRSILHFATQRGNIELMTYLLSNLNARQYAEADYRGQSLLHYAAESRRTDAIDLVMRFGVDGNARDDLGRTALHHAVLKRNLAGVKHLIHHVGVERLDCMDTEGETPLDIATRLGLVPIVEHLLLYGAARSSTQNMEEKRLRADDRESSLRQTSLMLRSTHHCHIVMAAIYFLVGVAFCLVYCALFST